MGHYSRKPYEGQRPHSVKPKIEKEIECGRIKRKSPQQHSIKERQRRLNELESTYWGESSPKRREPIYLQYANLAASCPPEVFKPSEIQGLQAYSDLNDNDRLRSLATNGTI